MDLHELGLFATQLAMGFALAASAGLRAFLPLLAAGVLARQGYLTLGPSFAWMASTPALVVFGSAVVFEVLGDKIPIVDHALDTAGLVVKPAAGTLLAASLFTHMDPMVATALGLVGGGAIAGIVHAMKGTTRIVSTGTTGGIANPLLSFVEDAMATLGIAIAFLVPILAALLVVALVGYGAVRLTRGLRKVSRDRSTTNAGS
ncbi:MAG: DUF4126 domain-containing protein [Usitatibacter sp.]